VSEDRFDLGVQCLVVVEDGGTVEETDTADGPPEAGQARFARWL
jgi:hypothetical protein